MFPNQPLLLRGRQKKYFKCGFQNPRRNKYGITVPQCECLKSGGFEWKFPATLLEGRVLSLLMHYLGMYTKFWTWLNQVLFHFLKGLLVACPDPKELKFDSDSLLNTLSGTCHWVSFHFLVLSSLT